MLNRVKNIACLSRFYMLHNIKPLSLHRVFHGIRFKVNKDWVSGIDTLLFFITISPQNLKFFATFALFK